MTIDKMFIRVDWASWFEMPSLIHGACVRRHTQKMSILLISLGALNSQQCVCVCVCVHHINRLGLNLMINNAPKKTTKKTTPPQTNAVADPVRGLPDRREKGKQKGAAPGYKLQKLQKRMRKTIPQKAKSEIPNPVGKGKAKQKQNRKSKRDDNRHERSRTLKPGGRSKRCTHYGAWRTMEKQSSEV